MVRSDAGERNLRDGDPVAALAELQERVREHPGDAKLRVFLFQLLCVLGQGERALTQLKVACELDPIVLSMSQIYGDAVRCEALRRDVFDGKKSPMILGEPEQWLALLIESLLREGQGGDGAQLRARAFEEADTSTGSIDGRPFTWIADADSRLGPVLEAVINGRYYWIPFSRLGTITMEAPTDLRDAVWMPAQLVFQNGGEQLALIPTRYPGSESSPDGLIALARKTVWEEVAADTHHGLGQRIIATDTGDTPLMDIRVIAIDGRAEPAGEPAGPDRG